MKRRIRIFLLLAIFCAIPTYPEKLTLEEIVAGIDLTGSFSGSEVRQLVTEMAGMYEEEIKTTAETAVEVAVNKEKKAAEAIINDLVRRVKEAEEEAKKLGFIAAGAIGTCLGIILGIIMYIVTLAI